MLVPGPSGWRQSVPKTWRHQGALAIPRVGSKSAGRKAPKTKDQPAFSASVRWPVASTNSAKRALVTATGAIQKGGRSISRIGPSRSWGNPSGSSVPIRKLPPSATMPSVGPSLALSGAGAASPLGARPGAQQARSCSS